MTPSSTRTCSQCHAPIEVGTRYCLNCGAPTDLERDRATEAASYHNAHTAYGKASTPDGQPLPAPSPQQVPGALNYNTPNAAMPTPPYNYPSEPLTPPYGYPSELPAQSPYSPNNLPPPPPIEPYSPYSLYTPAKTPSRKRLYGIITAIVIVGLVLTGVLFAVFRSSGQNNIVGPGTPTPTATLGSSDTEPLNLTVIYSSDQINVTSVQQAAGFSDDKITYQSYTNIVRVNTKETQLSKRASFFSYTSSFRLLLPGNAVISPTKSQAYTAPETGVIRTNWVDFGVSSKYDLTKLVLRLGTDDEAQIAVPLQANADLAQYQPKTTSQNKTVTYAGVNWTFQSVTQGLSADGEQAKSGQVYVTVSLLASNPGADDFDGYDYFRLKSGDTVASQTSTSSLNQPFSIKSGTNNIAITATFLVTSASSYTLIFVATTGYNPASEVRIDFTL